MKHLILLAVGLLSLLQVSSAQEPGGSVLMAGVQYSKLGGTGEAGDEFVRGYGYVFEYGVSVGGWGFTMFGLSRYWSDNVVYEDRRQFKFFQPYFFDVRRYFGRYRVCPFIAAGLGMMRMKPENSQGYDNCYLLSSAIGVQLRLRSGSKVPNPFLQAIYRPSYVMGNSLGRSLNTEFHVGIGIIPF